MFSNLKSEFVKRNLQPCLEIARTLNCNERTARNKLNGVTRFTVEDAKAIKRTHFPTLTIEYLFATDETAAVSEQATTA